MTSPIGLFGKHASYGDFVSHRVDAAVQTWLQGWLDTILPDLRDGLGDRWETSWDAAPPVRFWIGRGLAGRTIAGLLVASRDKVGRRYPLVILASSAAIAAPVIDPAQDFYDRLQDRLINMDPEDDIKDVVSALPSCRSEDDVTAQEGPLLWAHHPDGDLGALLRSAAGEDAKRAVTARSYWWVAARTSTEPSVWLGNAGLPDTATLGWLLFGQTVQSESAHAQN